MSQTAAIKAEAFDVMQYFYRTVQDPLVRCCARLDGHIDVDALKRAVTLSSGAVPLIFCRFDISGRQPVWVPARYTAEDAVHVLDAEGNDPDYPERLLAKTSVDIFLEPQVKILVARGTASDAVCMLMSHLVCDGGGFKDYLYLLCDLYGKCRANPAHAETLKPSPRGVSQLFWNRTLLEEACMLAEKGGQGGQYAKPVVPMQGDGTSPFIAARAIPSGRFETIRRHGVEHGSTVNDMLLAAYLRWLSRETGEGKLSVPCPVDLRKYLPDGEARFCNLTSNLFCDAEVSPGEPFEATLRKVSACMAGQKQSEACLKGPLKLKYLYPFLSFKTFGENFNKLFSIPVTSFTNLGVLDDKRFRFEGTGICQAYITAAVKRVPYFQLTASTYGGCCTLTCNLHGAPEDRVRIETMLEQIDKEMAGESI